MTIGKNIAKYRRTLKLTQEELGNQLGVSNQAVSKWESDVSMPDVMLLPDIAKTLHITLEELYGIPVTHKENRVTADEFPIFCHNKLIDTFYYHAGIKFSCTGPSDGEQLEEIRSHMSKGTRLGCTSNTQGAIIITNDFSFIDCAFKAEGSGNIIRYQGPDAHALNYLTDKNFRKVFFYQYNKAFCSSQADKVHGVEFTFDEIMQECNLSEEETSAALRLLINLNINEKCKDLITQSVTYYFLISKALYVHAIYKLASLLTEDDCWTIVRDTSIINDYCFKSK